MKQCYHWHREQTVIYQWVYRVHVYNLEPIQTVKLISKRRKTQTSRPL